MRLCGCISLSFLSFLQLVATAQVSWETQRTTTLVDALSADPDYTSLLHLLQRALLIPTLNKLNGSTLFAPTNEAIERHSYSNSLWITGDGCFNDNVRDKLRQELLYHLLNFTIQSMPTDSSPEVLKTLHYPKTYVEPPTNEPPPMPPWLPVPGGTLGGEPQRLRIASREDGAWVGVDAFGEGGAQVVKDGVGTGNGVVLGIGDVLQVPPSLVAVVSQLSSVTYFNKVLTPEATKLLNSTSELTLFLPVNEAWEKLDPLERLYLESEWATDDLDRIVKMHAVSGKRVKWSESFKEGLNLTTLDGTRLEIVETSEKTVVSTADLVQPDIYASNGVLHLVSSLIIPPGALELTPEKYLLALNCTSFVSLLHSVNLTSLINDTSAQYTILAPRDDVLSIFGDSELPEKGSEELRKLLQYHFIPGRWSPKKLKDGILLETVLEEPGLDGGSQVLSIEVNGHEYKDTPKNIRFGGAGVIGDHVEVNNTLIYFISRPLVPPSNALQTVLPILDLSSFLAAIFSTTLADTLKTTPRTTILIPHNDAFKRLGMLVSDHLLAASSASDLEQVIKHHVIDGVEYASSLRNGSQKSYPTLEGTDFQMERPENGSIVISASGGWAGMRSELYPTNMLTQTGVVHELSDLMIPRSVSLTIGKLAKSAKGTIMTSLVIKAGFDWILNGTAPPEGSPWADQGLPGVGWTLLCPTDDAFKKINLTKLYDDITGLHAIVSQHLIQASRTSGRADVSDVLNNNRPLALDEPGAYSTLLSPSTSYGDVVFRQVDNSNPSAYVVGIKGARGTDSRADWARVLSWGRSTTGGGTGGVIQIDRLLMPYQPTRLFKYGAPTALGVSGVVLICLFFVGVRTFWRRDTTEATYEPVGGFGNDDDES